MRRQMIGLVIAAVLAVGCGSQANLMNPVAPSSLSAVEAGSGGRATTRQAGIQCSDAPVPWVTSNFSPEGRSARIYWVPVPNIGTYEVEVRHNRNGEVPKFVYSFTTDLTEASIDDKEDGGRYYVRVRVYNACNTYGAWSETLIIYIEGGTDNAGKGSQEPPNGGGDDDDGNNGHGNDDDGDDDSNPGGGNDDDDLCEAEEEDNNNGHGNDCDKDDDSNPSGH
jgi:hypothetical protein